MREVVLGGAVGLHARAAAMVVKMANRFHSAIFLEHHGNVANAKSILGIMTLGASSGGTLILRADGHDAEQAIRALENLLRNGFPDELSPIPENV